MNRAVIKVVGVGGAGNNAIKRMKGVVQGVEFIAINTDVQALEASNADIKIAIGDKVTKGLGSGGDPSVGQRSAEESKDQIRDVLSSTDLVFITAGMGGGTGTGASPIVARIARELGILTVGVVTKPFGFEGRFKEKNADIGISNLNKFVDCNIVVPNQKLVIKGVTVPKAFEMADDILRQGIQSVTDLIIKNMTINVDFADIANIMRDSGIAHMGIGEASGEHRVFKAIQQAIQSPLLGTSIKNASQIIMSITGGEDLEINEVDNYVNLVKDALDENFNMKFGVDVDPDYKDRVRVIIIATGICGDDKTPFTPPQPRPQSAAAPVRPVDDKQNMPKRPIDNTPPYIKKLRGEI
jgi:cell division protein FtsZ